MVWREKCGEIDARQQVAPAALVAAGAVILAAALLVDDHHCIAYRALGAIALGGRLVVVVLAVVEQGRNAVAGIELVHHLGSDVVVFHVGVGLQGAGPVVELLEYGLCNEIEVGHACGNVKRRVASPYRALGLHPAREHAQAQQSVVAVVVSLLDAHVDHARQP